MFITDCLLDVVKSFSTILDVKNVVSGGFERIQVWVRLNDEMAEILNWPKEIPLVRKFYLIWTPEAASDLP